jgi:hypothetical protein
MRRALVAVLAIAVAATMVGCAQPVPQVKPNPKPAQAPAVVESVQVERILADLGTVLAASDEAKTADGLDARLGGAALTMRQAEFKLVAADPNTVPTVLNKDFDSDSQIVAQSTTWPRSFIAVSASGDGEAQVLYLMTQADARSPYKLVAWARMLPVTGLATPATAKALIGSPVVAVDNDEGLTMTPNAALELYAKAKDAPAGPEAALLSSAPKDGKDPDPVRQRFTAQIEALKTGTAAVNGAVTAASAVVENSGFAIRTADNGSLVFGQVKSVMTAKLNPGPGEGGGAEVPALFKALGAQGDKVKQSLQLEYLQTVVLAVPPSGSDLPVQVIAVAEVPVAAAAA